jgi:hypothetical protein
MSLERLGIKVEIAQIPPEIGRQYFQAWRFGANHQNPRVLKVGKMRCASQSDCTGTDPLNRPQAHRLNLLEGGGYNLSQKNQGQVKLIRLHRSPVTGELLLQLEKGGMPFGGNPNREEQPKVVTYRRKRRRRLCHGSLSSGIF